MQAAHTFAEESLLSSQVTWFVRSLSRGVPRHYKSTYLLQRWHRAQQAGRFLEEAIIFAEFSCKPPPSLRIRVPFNFNALSDAVCKKRFRFDKSELCTLVKLLNISDVVTRERTTATATEALCVVLYKLAAPVRWEDVVEFFGRSSSGLSNIFLHLVGVIDKKFARLILFNHEIAASRLVEYAQAVFDAGSPYTNVWCFIDGTVRGVCRPTPRHGYQARKKLLTQQSIYNGHKRKHALKFQTLVTPDGLISHLFGPYPGRNHDIKMYRESQLSSIVRSDPRFRGYRIFGDCAYGRDDVMLSPFEGAIGNLTQDQKLINASMSKIRVSVEWSYAQIVNYWKALDFKSNLRTGTQPVGQMYRVGVLMTNCITCIRGGNTASDYFGISPPDISEYLLSEN